MKKVFVFCATLVFLFFISEKFCFTQIDYNAGLNFSSLENKEINLGEFKHINFEKTYEENPSPLIWKVLKVGAENLSLISKYAVDYKTFSSSNNSDWESSGLKTWLDNDFLTSFGEDLKSQIKNLSLPYVANDKVFISDDVELNDWKFTCKNDESCVDWWTKTLNKGSVKIVKYQNDDYKIGSYSAKGKLFVRPCFDLSLSSVIYFDSDNGDKFSFVIGDSVGQIDNVEENYEVSNGEDLNLNFDVSDVEGDYSVAYKIISSDNILSYGIAEDKTIKTSDLSVGDYEVYIWLQKGDGNFNLTSEPKKFKLKVSESNPEITNVKFSPCAHRKNFEKNISVDISGKNFKANDLLEIKFFNGDNEIFSQSETIENDNEKLSLVIESNKLCNLPIGNYNLKIILRRNDKILIEKNLDYKYVVSDLPVVSEIILTPSALNISLDEKKIDFRVKLDDLQENDEVISGEAYIFNDCKEKIVECENIFSDDYKNYFGQMNLPDNICVGSYKFDCRFKIKNNFLGDEQIISSSAVDFSISQLKLNKPKVNLAGGRYFSAQRINLESDENAKIFYTLDGSVPNENSNVFDKPFVLSNGNYILKAIEVKKNYEASEILEQSYNIICSSGSSDDNFYDEEVETKDEADKKLVVINKSGVKIEIESKETDESIILYPTAENLKELINKNKVVQLDLDTQKSVGLILTKEEFIADNLSELNFGIKNFGSVSLDKNILNELTGHDVSIEVGRGSFIFNIKIDGKDFISSKNEFDISFAYNADKKFDACNLVVFRYSDNERKIILKSFYNPDKKIMRFKTKVGGRFDVLYNKIGFSDTNDKEILYLAARNILNGVGENKFLPEVKIKRADFLIALMRIFDIEPDFAANNFFDCEDKYYSGYTAAAKKLKLVNGVGENNFAPEKFLTFNDMYCMAKRFFAVESVKTENNFVTRKDAAKFLYVLFEGIL